MIEETSAGIILFRKEDSKILFLLLHYPSGHWDFIKGKMEEGESTHETAIREAKEETGITDITFLENFKEWIKYDFQYQGELVHKPLQSVAVCGPCNRPPSGPSKNPCRGRVRLSEIA